MTCCGRLFQTRAAATGKARLPTVDSCVWRTISDNDEDAIAVGPRGPLVGEVHRQGMTAPTRVDTCTQGRRSWMQSALEPSASGAGEGAGWCGRTSTTKTSAKQRRSLPTGAAVVGMMEYRPGSRCRSPVETERDTSRTTGGWVSTLTDGYSAADAAPRNRTTQSSRHETSSRCRRRRRSRSVLH
jgi:hypothetical protein